MIICTIHFDQDKSDFSKLLKVWEYTARLYHPDADIKILTVPKPENIDRECRKYMSYSSSYAFLKMSEWAIKRNDKIIMTDADIMFTRSCYGAFKNTFDIGITVRKAQSFVNAGVLFYRPSGKEKLQKIIDLTKEIVNKPLDYIEELYKYLGADQAAITMLSKQLNFFRFPCHEYNLEQSTWQWYNENTKIVHMKSSLWDLVQNETPRIGNTEDNHVYEIFDLWKEYLRQADDRI